MHKFLVSIVATTDRDKYYLSLVVVVARKGTIGRNSRCSLWYECECLTVTGPLKNKYRYEDD